MSIFSVGLNQSVGASGWRSSIRQANQDFEQLFQSLQNGNLSAAQQAYNNFQQLQAGLTSAATPASTAVTPATTAPTPVASDWSALGQALQSGDLTSAQTALGKLQQDAQTVWQSHLQQQAQAAQSVYALMQGLQGATATTGATASSTSTTTGSVQNDLTALNQALQSGDSAAAEKLLAQLEQDLQASGQATGQNYGGHHHHHHGGLFGMNAASAYATPAATSVTSTPVGPTGTTSSTGTSTVA